MNESQYSIFTYNLDDCHSTQLSNLIKNKTINGKPISQIMASDLKELSSSSYLLAFLNFSGIKEADEQKFVDCMFQLTNSKFPLTHIINWNNSNIEHRPNLFRNSSIFENKENLRLTILQECKNAEGIGRVACENSIRLRRVLKMYQWLLNSGSIDKQCADEVCISLGIDLVSQRMFQRDIKILREIDTRVKYDKAANKYVINVRENP